MFADVAADAFNWKVMVALSAVTGSVCSIITVIIMSRRQPPLPEELYKNYATKADLETLRGEGTEAQHRTDESVRRLHARIDELRDDMHTGFESNSRALGRIEGKLEAQPPRMREGI